MRRAILVEPETAEHVGFAARLVENFALDGLVLVGPRCDLAAAEATASNAQDTLRTALTPDSLDACDFADHLVGTTAHTGSSDNLQRAAVPPGEAAAAVPADADVDLVFGREGTGLTNAELDRCDVVVSIPAAPAYPVLNLTHAMAIVCHAFFTGEGTQLSGEPASRAQREALTNLFKAVTGSLDWEAHRQEKAVRAFRNVLGRAYVTGTECQQLLGALSDIDDVIGD